jgi:primosomal protein N' (replication factor Y)
MHYYEVWIADGRYHGSTPLTYSSKDIVAPLSVVSVPLRNSLATGFVVNEAPKPAFSVKDIRSVLSDRPLPFHCIQLAQWLKDYYQCTYGEALRQFAPSVASVRRSKAVDVPQEPTQEDLHLDDTLTDEQSGAIEMIQNHPSVTVMLHGDTGSGKTRVYLELAEQALASGRSVIILTPEIALTTQLQLAVSRKLSAPIYTLHSELTQAERKKTWFKILESKGPMIIIGPRSALFAPVSGLGLIVVDEAHEPAYKQDQSPKYHTPRVASQLGLLTSSKVILGSATPSVADYYLASEHDAIVRMKLQAKSSREADVKSEIIDLRTKANFTRNRYLSDRLISEVNEALSGGKQALIYFNRRGSARLILCDKCGWQLLCPNCDIPLVYHGDEHEARCHICGYKKAPPRNCPSCGNADVIYTSIGTKTLVSIVQSIFPNAKVQRFDSDNTSGERLNDAYDELHRGDVDILVGTQLIAKGLDLPKLSLVGIISAETSLALPDYTAEERTFQLLYQVIGRVGRHGHGKVIIQSFEPSSPVIQAAATRDYAGFYKQAISERQDYRFPPFSYLMKAVCRRATLSGAQNAAEKLKKEFTAQGLPVEVTGPSPSFYQRRGRYYYYQLVVKAKDRKHLTHLASLAPAGWSIDLDPLDLL